ncbi:MAG: hypothetical protein JXA69_18735 [Phycisphaerae bacterium]|nr:hypothetical protein [Phycisphaerae bacterium]
MKKTRIAPLVVVVSLACLTWAGRVHAATNLVRNPGFEIPAAAKSPDGWSPLVIGAPAEFVVDAHSPHSGQASLRLRASEITRSYIESAPIAVAAGETLAVSAWVKSRDVPADKGTIIVIAAFAPDVGGPYQVSKVAVADRREDWQRLEGHVSVPAGAAVLRLRLGLSYSMGTLWWDDVRVEAAEPLVARVDVPEARLYPAQRSIPVVLLNRERVMGEVAVHVRLDKKPFAETVVLTGQPAQRIAVPVVIGARGKREVSVELRRPGSEAVVFASGLIGVTVPPPLTLGPLTPTHWAIEDGPPQFGGELEVALADAAGPPCELVVRVLDEEAEAVTTWSRTLNNDEWAGVMSFTMGVPDAGPGDYHVVVELRQATREPVTAEQPWTVIPRRAARTVLNADGFLEQDGRAVFPLGMFNNQARLAESAAAGFTIVHYYNAARVRSGQRPDDQRLKTAMDEAERHGMRCLLMVPLEYAFAGEWDAFRRRIRMFRNHPALLAWDEEEGVARGDMTPETLNEIRRILRVEDPHHPLMVGDSRDVIGRVSDRGRFFPVDSMDLGMWWWYPFPLRSQGGDALQGEEASAGMALPLPTFLTERTTDKPIWVGVQAYKKPGADGRYPTPTEYRAQAYLALIHGAEGLMWYGGSVTGGLFLKPEEGHWDDLRALVGELREQAPLWMAATAERPTVRPDGAPIAAVIKTTNDGRVLFCANESLATHDVQLIVPGLSELEEIVPVLYEERAVMVTDGVLRDTFGPLAVHVYALPLP